MKATLASLFSYLFMASSFAAVISIFALSLIVIRYIVGTASEDELDIAYVFFVILVSCLFVIPISLYLSEKFGKSYKDIDLDV
jgi:hypothetical protein